MCGIAGMMTKAGGPPDQAVLARLEQALAHRGPDGRGRHVAGSVGLAHTRLAIVDLATGDQPLFAAAAKAAAAETAAAETAPGRQIALVANGEIYNDLSLRRALADEPFRTGSDCEPPLYLYRRHGDAFADHLRGMYAIAIHDPGIAPEAGGSAEGDNSGAGRGERLLLARDPFGIKPLYYVETSTLFAFASEPQALIAAGLVPAAVDGAARDELLQLQFTTGRHTVLAGVQRVLPGETLVVEGGRIVRRRRRESLPPGSPLEIDEHQALEALDALLTDSVRVHQRSDVPYGMFLSGGVDSSVILAVMAALAERPVVTFTVGFPATGVHDERANARAVAAAVGAEHIELSFTEEDFWQVLPQVAAATDDPAADYAALPSYRLAEAARQTGIKVVLTGEGGDELFAGYGRYRRALRPRLLGGRPMRTRGAFDGMAVLAARSHWRDGIAAAEQAARLEGRSPLQVAQAVDCAEWLPNDLLIKLDRCLMAHGVEGRVPLIDPHLGAFAFRLPDRLKVDRSSGKRLLRRWLERRVPAARPFARKRGFTVPVAQWISGRAAELAPLLARQECLRDVCRPGAVERLLAAAARGNGRAGHAAWILLYYALWHRRHVAGLVPEADVFATLS